jgi:hypothetical protein
VIWDLFAGTDYPPAQPVSTAIPAELHQVYTAPLYCEDIDFRLPSRSLCRCILSHNPTGLRDPVHCSQYRIASGRLIPENELSRTFVIADFHTTATEENSMKSVALALALAVVCCSFTASAQSKPPAPSPEQKRLDVFVGTWSGSGKMEKSPFGDEGATTSTMTCAWYTGGYHLVCDSEDSGPMGKLKGHSLYGYHPDKKQYITFGIDSTGFGGAGIAKVDGSNWTFEGNDTVGGKPIWFRTAVRLITPKELTWKSDYSEDGKTWKMMGEGKMTKK